MKTTHPDIATLATPLSASRIEGVKTQILFYAIIGMALQSFAATGLTDSSSSPFILRCKTPLSTKGEERVAQRSVGGVSLTTMLNLIFPA